MIDLGLGHVRLGPDELDGPVALGREYAPPAGLPGLCAAIADRDGVTPQHIAVTTGASTAFTAALATAPRGKLLCPRPYHPAHPKVAETLGFQVMYYDLEERLGWLPDPDRLARQAANASAVIWSFPSNPTGSVAPPDLLQALGELVQNSETLVISDEVYADLVFDSDMQSRLELFVDAGRLIRIRSFSKSFRIPGERLGYVVADPQRAAAIVRSHWELAMSAPVTAQALALAILQDDPDYQIARLKKVLREHRDQAVEILRRSERLRVSPPHAGLFCWVELLGESADSVRVAVRCFDEKGVVVIPGYVFGMHDRPFLRVSFAVPRPELERGLEALIEVVER